MTSYSGNIAIVGMAGLYPKADDIDLFWDNIRAGRDCVTDATDAWLGGADILDPDSTELLKIYTARGGFLGDLSRFDPREFGTMPFSVAGAQPDQFLALKICRDALVDAGYAPGETDHHRTGVILGHSIHVHRANTNGLQQVWFNSQIRSLLRSLFPNIGEDRIHAAIDMMQAKLPDISSESVPGLVPNILTGRIANRFDLMGPNYVIDAACSSSIISVDLAMTELRTGRADMMLAGGVNTTTSPLVYSVFCSVGALSREGKIRPFSTDANGTVLGEGVGALVLKRVEDALAAEDRIYAVVKAVGQSSDGKSSGLMAPRFEGEVLAMRRTYENSGLDPASIGLVEAHGTGIPLGDKTEVAALREVFGPREGGVPRVPIGSVKSMIGHCIPAAGSAAIIKTALALSHRTLPPTLCGEVNNDLGFEDTPFYVSTAERPWINSAKTPRRAAINAFGFGGINAHMVLEESPMGRSVDATASFLRPVLPETYAEQVFVLAAADQPAMLAAIAGLFEQAQNADASSFAALARDGWTDARETQWPQRLGVVAKTPQDLIKKLSFATKQLDSGPCDAFQTRNGTFYNAAPTGGKVAFLFPGEMAQYEGIMADGVTAFAQAGDWFDTIASLSEGKRSVRLQDVAFAPRSSMSAAGHATLDGLLHQVDYGSEMVFAADQAAHAVLQGLGVKPDGMLGHSTGENAAIVASGYVKIARDAVGEMIAQMNEAFIEVNASGVVPQGVLLTVAALPRDAFLAVFESHKGLHFTMDNCPNQAIVFGSEEVVNAAEADLVAQGAICTRLPISWGYHTAYVAPMAEKFEALFQDLQIGPSDVTLYSCATAKPFPIDKAGFIDTSVAQYVSRVRFTEGVEQMYADGYRIFVECGPNANLTAFVRDILGDRAYVAEAADNRRSGMVAQLRVLVARLFAAGLDLPFPDMLAPAESADRARRRKMRAVQAKAPHLASELPFVQFAGKEAEQLRDLLFAGMTVPAAPAVPVMAAAPAAMPQRPPRPARAAPAHASSRGVQIDMVDLRPLFQVPFAFQGYLMRGIPSLQAVSRHLAPSELAEAHSLAAQPKRWTDWALGRLAVKRATRMALVGHGYNLPEPQIEIVKTDLGGPYVQLAVQGILAPSVSIAHVAGVAVAAAADQPWRIGIDFERPDRVRNPSDFIARISSTVEAQRLTLPPTQDTAALIWSMKEAASKALGVGLQGQPQLFEVVEIDPAHGHGHVIHQGITVATRTQRIGGGLCTLGFSCHVPDGSTGFS
jgi:acyl transferase domain-containing protein/phosphopantetheinyl transferase